LFVILSILVAIVAGFTTLLATRADCSSEPEEKRREEKRERLIVIVPE
jgi:Na+-transporting methylmalonyl-CoA/oxaloacetate decarboxylase gamma subunit